MNEKLNQKCQIFTPSDICEKILEIANYKDNLYGKKVLENSCGDGNILSKIVKRYIVDSIAKGYNKIQIKKGLENDIYAFEIDGTHKENCIRVLNNITREYNIANVKWNIFKKDYLKYDIKEKFDYIIGNPPYISYRDLSELTRNYVKDNFLTCKKGKFDYCYAFIEKSVNNLKEKGILTYIIPNSLFKNEFAVELRNYIIGDIIEIFDYKSIRVFPNALTSSAIIKLKKNNDSNKIKYYDYSSKKESIIEKYNFGKKWIFDNNYKEHKLKFGDYFDCSISVATLRNEVFVIKNYTEDDNYIYFRDNKIEKTIVRDTVSPRNLASGLNEKIIFPYYYGNGNLCRYEEEVFKKKFKNCYKYLLTQKNVLDKRKSDNNSKWYEYGRSQALVHLNQEKLIISTVITNDVRTYLVSKHKIPYSGIYIIPNKDVKLIVAEKILKSKSFLNYISKIGINTSGNSLRITSKDIKDYSFREADYNKWKD